MKKETIGHGESHRSLEVTHREALALLAALELSPFDDEILTQKLLSLVYTDQTTHPTRHRPRKTSEFIKHHRTVG